MGDKEIKIDYISVTFPLVLQPEDNELEIVMDTVKMISNYLCFNYVEVKREEYSTLRFKYQYNLGESTILRLSGPENDSGYRTCHLELRGEGCRDFERRNDDKTWYDFFMFMLRLNGEFKRIDIAIDDKSGCEIKLDKLYEKIKNGRYTSCFNKPPKPIGFIDTGLSITFGSTQSSTQLCIYDKKIEQLNKGKEVIDDYWVRYEMRFRYEKADAVIYSFMTQYENSEDEIYGFNLRNFAFEQLYGLLDIKEDNNKNRRNQGHMDTDASWNSFLGDVKKGKIKLPDEKEFSYESNFKWVKPKAMFYLLVRYVQCNRNKDDFIYELFKELYKLSNLNDRQIKRLNMFLHQMNIKPLTPEMFLDVRKDIFSTIEDMEIPF